MPNSRNHEQLAARFEAKSRVEMIDVVAAFMIPEACLDCEQRSSECAAGIIEEIREESLNYDNLTDIDKRRIKIEVKLLPPLTLLGYHCVDVVAEYGRPVEVDLEEIEERYRSSLTS